ncbi:SLATT domain-containing protein [Agrobacterium rhizogenes]|nr:SLATT domain-containing protein [Rhizobium rhizogenes]NTH59634.1 SLATT domain-containing protein [Rhizobium rhizogenes]NTH91263.1 SLATT domain-containing protein [Rhizobium rhizogenes]
MSEEKGLSNIDDRIWITSRVRMIAERKALRNQNISYMSVTYYSLFTVIVAVFSKFYVLTYPLLEEINLSASVVVLVASLVSGGFRFETSATVYRECYLKLQRLQGEDLPPEKKEEKYNEILWDYPNHSNNEYYDFIINHACLEGKKLTNGTHELKPTAYMWFSYLFRRAFYYGTIVVLFTAPVVFLGVPLIKLWK